jgi:hypothetical protein
MAGTMCPPQALSEAILPSQEEKACFFKDL